MGIATVPENPNVNINVKNGQSFDDGAMLHIVCTAINGHTFVETPKIIVESFNPITGSFDTEETPFNKKSETSYELDYEVYDDFEIVYTTQESEQPVEKFTATIPNEPDVTINLTNGQKIDDGTKLNLVCECKSGRTFDVTPVLVTSEFNPMTGSYTDTETPFTAVSNTKYTLEYTVASDFEVRYELKEQFTATVPVNPNVTINLTNGQKIDIGTSLNIRCEVKSGNEFVSTPTLTYQEFKPSTGSYETVALDFVKENETVYTLSHKVTEDFTVSYKTQTVKPIVKYSITNELTNCTSNIPEGTEYEENSIVEVIVNSNEGYKFTKTPKLYYFNPTQGVPYEQEFTKVSDTQYKTTATMEHDWTVVAEAEQITPISEGYGVITVYNPTAKELQEISKKRFFGAEGKEIDIGKYIIDLYKIFVPVKTGNPSSVHLGIHDTQVMSKVVTDDVLTFDCGTVMITGKYQNRSDYNADVEIYLPFIGKQKLPTNRVMDRSVNLTYKVNTLNGDIIAFVSTVDGYKEYFTGKCRMSVPYILMEHTINNQLSLEADFMIQENPSITVVYNVNIPVANINDTRDTGRIGDKPKGFTRMTDIILADTSANITEQKFIIETLQNGIIL